ncbi:MAG: glycosyltransferase [Candidatus Omnitrophica bacterium]|nr:glycosyltransferase [Candidatus Omnitrophota bacterium]
MMISIETPVFKGRWLERCIESVLYQSSPNWSFSLLWDGGDEQSRRILEQLEGRRHPNVQVHFGNNRGIARARRFLSEHSRGDFILPLDDDDALPFYTVERFLSVAEAKPWAAVIRGQRKFIDEEGKIIDTRPWFPFEPRHYQRGMVTDLMNHTQPYLIRRSAYERTSGWEGFDDFGFAGEDCDIYLKLEEAGTIELLDQTLYYYRINPHRASLVLTDQGAYEMWRRLADKTIARIGLPLKRVNDKPPFQYERVARSAPTLDLVDFVVVASDEHTMPSGATGVAQGLRQAGIPADALHVVRGPMAGALNQGFRRATRPLVCVLDATVQVDGRQPLETLLRLMGQYDADLAAPKLVTRDGRIVWADPGFGNGHRPEVTAQGEPDEGQYDQCRDAPWLCEKLVLCRREVIRAVGGLDDGYDHERTAVVDFCLRARQRDFKCAYLGAVAFSYLGSEPASDVGPDLPRLRDKWADYPHLFARQDPAPEGSSRP